MSDIDEARLARAREVCRKWSAVQQFLRALPDPDGRIAALDLAIGRLGESVWAAEITGDPGSLLPQIRT